MYLKLSIAGHLTIFQTRTRGPWWSTRPAWILLGAVCGTQVIATLIAVYGAGLVTPLGWKYAGMVWGYALAWFLVTDPVKLLAYKVLDKIKAEDKPEARPQPEAKPDDAKPTPEAKADAQPDDAEPAADDAKPKPDPKPDAVTPPASKLDSPAAVKTPVKPAAPESAGRLPSEPSPQLVERVHKLYEELGRHDVQAVEAWDQAHRAGQCDDPDR